MSAFLWCHVPHIYIFDSFLHSSNAINHCMKMMSEITSTDVLASMPEGGTVLDILRAHGLPYSLEQKKCLNKLLYTMEKDGILQKHQPNPDRKPMWFRMRKPTECDTKSNEDDDGHFTAPES